MAQEQDLLGGDVNDVINEIADSDKIPEGIKQKVIRLLEYAEGAMDDAAGLLEEPNTGGEAIAAETEVIELLLKSGQGAGGGGGGGAGMQMLMSMMQGMGGASPGLNNNGGTTSDLASRLEGKGAGTDLGKRDINKGTGNSGKVLPAEYRSALDAYFEALETID